MTYNPKTQLASFVQPRSDTRETRSLTTVSLIMTKNMMLTELIASTMTL